MTVMIGRLGAAGRIFPPIQPDLYRLEPEPPELTPDQQAARKVLTLAGRNFTPLQRWFGWSLAGPDQVGRLLSQHRLALAAELAGHEARADFFWREIGLTLAALAKRPQVWEALVATVAGQPGLEIMADPSQLRQRLVEEIFIDTHCAFYNGLQGAKEKLSPQARAFIHIDYLQKLLPFSSLAGEALLPLLKAPLETRLSLYQEANQFEPALKICDSLLFYFPAQADYQEELARLRFTQTLANLKNGKSQRASLKDARKLQAGLNHLEQVHQKYPDNIINFELLGHLYHLRAIKLAQATHLSEALLMVQKALTFNPYLTEAYQTRFNLTQAMQLWQKQVALLRVQLAGRRNSRLTAQGQHLIKEADTGSTLVEAYAQSAQAQAVAAAFTQAQIRNIWRIIGLPEPPVTQDEQGQKLLAGINQILLSPPTEAANIPAAWGLVVTQNPDLAHFEREPVEAFIRRRLFPPVQAPETERVVFKTPTPAPPNPPLLAPALTRFWGKGEPLGYWLFSRQDLRLKLQALLALILLVLAGWLTFTSFQARYERDRAYTQIVAAAEKGDELAVIEGAERFLANPPLRAQDGRQPQVVEHYKEAFVHWFAGQTSPLNEPALTHVERYRRLLSETTEN